MNSVRLYYIKHHGENDLAQIDGQQLQRWIAELSLQKQASIERLININDRITSLLGLRLLKLCVQHEGINGFSLQDVIYPATGKPFWKNDSSDMFDFNISHSGNLIMIAVSRTLKVGVDVEKIRELKRLAFKMVLQPDELSLIQQSPKVFFDLWSKKEAVVKAANTAGLARMRDVKLDDEQAMLDDVSWQVKSVTLDNQVSDKFAIHLATSDAVDELFIKSITIDEL